MDRNGAQRNGKGYVVMLGITISCVPSHIITVVCSFVNFIHVYLSQLQSHTSSMLISLESCLKIFHCNKDIIVKLRIYKYFNIPKLHSLLHYVNCICSLGSANGYNTKSPEHLHIDFSKRLTTQEINVITWSKWPSGPKCMRLCGYGIHTWFGWINDYWVW